MTVLVVDSSLTHSVWRAALEGRDGVSLQSDVQNNKTNAALWNKRQILPITKEVGFLNPGYLPWNTTHDALNMLTSPGPLGVIYPVGTWAQRASTNADTLVSAIAVSNKLSFASDSGRSLMSSVTSVKLCQALGLLESRGKKISILSQSLTHARSLIFFYQLKVDL